MSQFLILSCEHYSNAVPERFSKYFADAGSVLASHRGYDIGAATLFEVMRPLSMQAFRGDWSRLVIELNRSLNHPKIYSEYSNQMEESDTSAALAYYQEYRARVEKAIATAISQGHQVTHVGVHSFTPVLDGEERIADIGLLYDPERAMEKSFCAIWKEEIKNSDSALRVRYNYPYHGNADGFTTFLRGQFSEEEYLGIELEVNQAFFQSEAHPEIMRLLKRSLGRIFSS